MIKIAIIFDERGIPITNANPFPVSVTGSNADVPAESLNTSLVDDGDGLGLLRVYLASVLSSGADSVALGGAIAEALRRQPATAARLRSSGAEVSVAGGSALTVLSTTTFTTVNFLDIIVEDGSFALEVTSVGDAGRIDGLYMTSGRANPYLDASNKSSLYTLITTQEGTGEMYFQMLKGLEFPTGVSIVLRNYAAGAKTVAYSGMYSVQ